MKTLFLFLSLFSFLFAEVSITNKTIYIDKTNKQTLNDILKVNQFHPVDNSYLGYIDGAVWSKIQITNHDNQFIKTLLKNNKHIVFELDVYLFSGDKLTNSYCMGASRALQNRPIPHKDNLIPIYLMPNETKTILIRNHSKAPINIDWEVIDLADFAIESIKTSTFWGIYGGLLLALIIYNFMIFLALKQIEFLHYLCLAFVLLLLQYSATGTLYVLDLGLNLDFLLYSTWITGTLTMLFLLLFADSFLKMKTTMPKLRRVLFLFVYISLGFVIIFLIGIVESSLLKLYDLLSFIFFLSAILLGIIAINGVKLKLEGAIYYLLGQGVLIASLIFSLLIYLSFIDLSPEFLILQPLGSLIDMIFLSMALGTKIKAINTERDKMRLSLLANARFISVGQAIANITHQWKTPLSRAGSLVMQIDDIIRYEKENINQLAQKPLTKLQSVIDFMAQSTYEICDFYKTEQKITVFSLNKEIQSIINILSGKNETILAEITLNAKEEVFLNNYRYALSNVLMIIIDNALDIFQERGTRYPKITIDIITHQTTLIIRIEDNGGGIDIDPIESIFDIFVSSKKSGLGLALAKNLIENKLQGGITATNTQEGGQFNITLQR